MSKFFTPKNDQELNALVESMNEANGKYFDSKVSSKRFNNLRDCICEGLGFKNGGYQELQAHWKEKQDTEQYIEKGFDFSNFNEMSILLSSRVPDYYCIAPSDFLAGLISILREFYPQNSQQLLKEDEIDQAPDDDGWSSRSINSEDIVALKELKKGNSWHPLFLGSIIVGYAFKKSESEILQGILNSACWHTGGLYLGSNGSFVSYITRNFDSTHLPLSNYIILHKESMERELLIPFSSFTIEDGVFKAEHKGQLLDITYCPKSTNIIFNGLEFEFIQFMTNHQDKLSLQLKGSRTPAEAHYFEWIGQGGLLDDGTPSDILTFLDHHDQRHTIYPQKGDVWIIK